jgi:uncharacterized membrane protein YoaK (UPF0700 family)
MAHPRQRFSTSFASVPKAGHPPAVLTRARPPSRVRARARVRPSSPPRLHLQHLLPRALVIDAQRLPDRHLLRSLAGPAHVATPSAALPTETVSAIDHTTAALLGAVAGSVDAVGWVALAGLLPSHLTASLVMIGASGGRGSADLTARLAMIPVFVVTVALVKALSRRLLARRLPVLACLLALLTAALLVFFVVGALTDQLLADDPSVLLGVGGFGVASMAVQNTIMRLCLAKHSPTTVMTGNLTQFVMALVDLPSTARDHESRARLRSAGMPLLGFVLGSVACGWLAGQHGLSSLCVPVALSAYATLRSFRALAPRARARPVPKLQRLLFAPSQGSAAV